MKEHVYFARCIAANGADMGAVKIAVTPAVQAEMDADDDMAEAVRVFCAAIRQAHHAVETGQHASFEDAMEAITGNRLERIDFDIDEEPFQ